MWSRRLLLFGVFIGALVHTSSGFAAEPPPPTPAWSQTFTGTALQLALGEQRVLVATASADAQPAAVAFIERLRGWNLPLVMDSTALGSLTGQGDQAIVKRASNLPVDRVVVVRVFGGVDVVVTTYDKAGVAKASFSGKLGRPLVLEKTPSTTSTSPTVHAPPVETAPPTVTLSDLPAPKSVARRTFENVAIYWSTGIKVKVNAWRASATTFTVPRKGRYGPRLRGASFYSAVGRADLAEDYQLRRRWKIGLGLSGGIAVLAGTGMTLAPIFEDISAAPAAPLFIGGLVVLGLGGVALVASVALDSHPLSFRQRQRIADDFNDELLRTLQAPAGRVSVTVSPTFSADGVGMGVSGKF